MRQTSRIRLPVALGLTLASLSPAFAATQASPRAIDPCFLLTRDEVAAAVGQVVEPGRKVDNGLTADGAYSTTCLWVAALPRGAAPDSSKRLDGRSFAILNVMNWAGGPESARKFLDDFRTAFDEHAIDAKPVSVDIGADESLWWGDGVAARKGGVSFGISVAPADGRAERRSKAESLARQIIQRVAGSPK